ncbi:MAG UNVERIFIED_CONTAM: hypothetical protein LVT10_21150 [Anaerolineae bacterium]
MRLFGVSLIAWILSWFWKHNGKVADGAVWVAIITMSVLFGVGHLPALTLANRYAHPCPHHAHLDFERVGWVRSLAMYYVTGSAVSCQLC